MNQERNKCRKSVNHVVGFATLMSLSEGTWYQTGLTSIFHERVRNTKMHKGYIQVDKNQETTLHFSPAAHKLLWMIHHVGRGVYRINLLYNSKESSQGLNQACNIYHIDTSFCLNQFSTTTALDRFWAPASGSKSLFTPYTAVSASCLATASLGPLDAEERPKANCHLVGWTCVSKKKDRD